MRLCVFGIASRQASAPNTPRKIVLTSQGIGDGAFVSPFVRQRLPFSALVFASWDFRLTDPAAASNLRRCLRSQLLELVSDTALQEVYVAPRDRALARVRRV